MNKNKYYQKKKTIENNPIQNLLPFFYRLSQKEVLLFELIFWRNYLLDLYKTNLKKLKKSNLEKTSNC